MNSYYLAIITVTAIILPSYVSAFTPICPNKTLVENCIRDAEYDWEIDRNKKNTDNRNWCCHQWQAYQCQWDLGNQCETGTWDFDTFNRTMSVVKDNLNQECTEYPQRKCSGLRWWGITLIVIGSLLLVALIVFLVFIFLIRKRTSRRYSAPKG